MREMECWKAMTGRRGKCGIGGRPEAGKGIPDTALINGHFDHGNEAMKKVIMIVADLPEGAAGEM